MRSSTKTFTILEYDGFVRNGLTFDGYQSLPKRTFDALEAFILANYTGSNIEPVEFLSLSARRGIGKIITARNYVGLITMKDGTVIEILPKICSDYVSKEDTKRIFLEMMRTLKDTPFKNFNVSNLNTDKLSLFEIFISMFIAEITTLVKQGLKSIYNSVEANEHFFKGKLNISQDIKYNYINKTHFFVRYDEWSVNRPENRLIKATLRLLQKHTQDSQNKLNISRLLAFFDEVNSSTDYKTDFSKCTHDRSMSHYEKSLSWCKIFLCGNSFTAFAGNEVAVALLFSMEKVFESYIAAKLRRHISHTKSDILMLTQDARYYLFEHPSKKFNLRPDIIFEKEKKIIVMDTKWKLLSEKMKNYGISNSDMYQMYVYGKKYKAEKVVLIYPLSENIHGDEIFFKANDGVKVEVFLIDLLKPDINLSSLLQNSVIAD
jgi:5-methylcytosine-specific restriction enzyme subunit McrC